MADYGVNIAVAVKNSQAVTDLSNRLKNTAAKIEKVNSEFNSLFNMTGKVLPGSIGNFNKALGDAAKNLNDVALNTKDAVTAAREFVEAQNAANAALRERDRLVKQIRLEGATVRQQPFGAAGAPGGPQLPPGFDPAVGRQRAIAQMVMLETAADVKVADAKRKYIFELNQIKLDLDRKARNAEIDNIIKEFQLENELQDMLFERAIKKDKEEGKVFMEQLGFKTTKELDAIEEVDKARKKSIREALTLTGQTSPIGGAENIPGSPAAKAKNERDQRFLRDKFNRDQRLRSATSSALIGGAFPLLFGQGIGASFGGAAGGFGGGMIGGEFGFGLSLVGTQLGSIFDQLVGKAGNLANSLNTTQDALSGLEEAGFKVSDATKSVIASYEEAGLLSDAYSLAISEVNRVLGPDGVDKLQAYKTETEKLQSEFEKVSGALQSELLPALTGFLRIVLSLKSGLDRFIESPLGKAVFNPAALKQVAFAVPGLGPLVTGGGELFSQLQKFGAPTGPAKKPEAQRLAEEAASGAKLQSEMDSNKTARESRYLVAARVELEKLGNNLLDERVVAAKQNIIQEQYLAAYRQAEGNEQEQLLAKDERELALLVLQNQVAAAQAQEAKRLASEVQKTTEERNTQITQSLTLEQKFAAELKQRQATTQLEADKARIAAEFEDRMRRIEKIGDNTLTIEAERLANQIKITDEAQAEADARLRSLQAANDLKDSQGEFEMQLETLQANAPGAFVGPFANSERTAFLGRRRMEIELERQQRKIDEAQKAVDSGRGSQTEVDNLIKRRDQYKFYQNQVLEATVAQQKFADALALTQPVTDSLFDSLIAVADGTKSAQEAFADFLSSIASILAETAKKLIAEYIAIGIARLFAGIGGAYGTGAEKPLTSGMDYSSAFSSGGFGIGGFANGGSVTGGSPMIVGERGPELFVPFANGEITSSESFGAEMANAMAVPFVPGGNQGGITSQLINRQENIASNRQENTQINRQENLRQLSVPFSRSSEVSMVVAAEQQTAEAISNPAPLDVRFESQSINGVEYVTAEQHQAGMAEAAQRGRALTLAALQNSVKARRRVGL